MARTYGMVLTRIWADTDWRALTRDAQWLYLALLSQPMLTRAGLCSVSPKRLARLAANTSLDDIEDALQELEQQRYVIIDYDTDELLIRSFLRHDAAWRQPKVWPGVVDECLIVTSDRLAAALHAESKRIDLGEVKASCSALASQHLARLQTALAGRSPETEETVPDTPGDTHPDTPEDTHPHRPSRGRGGARPGPGPGPGPSPGPTPEPQASSSSAAERREDVDRLCDLLADLVEANGSNRPHVTKAWRTACRLALDTDGRTPSELEGAIRWSQADEFWRSNVLSMPKLRAQYDRLRLQAQRQQPTASERHSTTDQRVAQGQVLAARFADLERTPNRLETA